MGYYKSAIQRIAREIHLLFKQAFFSLLIIAKVSNRASFAVFTYKCLRKNEGECPTTTTLGLELVVRSSTIGCQTCHFHPLYTSLSISVSYVRCSILLIFTGFRHLAKWARDKIQLGLPLWFSHYIMNHIIIWFEPKTHEEYFFNLFSGGIFGIFCIRGLLENWEGAKNHEWNT